jgi:hypothetical protein
MSLPSDEMEAYRIGQLVAMYAFGIWSMSSHATIPLADIGTVPAHLDMLPDVRLWVDDAHIRLVSSAVHQNPVVHLKERVSRIILLSASLRRSWRTGECCPVVALLAKGME